MKLDKCIFCQIAQGDETERKIFSGSDLIVILSKNPQTRGHLLVIPKSHFNQLSLIPLNLQAKLFQKAVGMGELLKLRLNAKAFVVKVNNELYKLERRGHVSHVHLHVIPRYSLGEKMKRLPSEVEDEELIKIRYLLS